MNREQHVHTIHATVITDKMVPTTATGDHTVRPHKQIAIHFPFNISPPSLPLTSSLSPHPSPPAHIHPPRVQWPWQSAMAPWLTLHLPPRLPFQVNKYILPNNLYLLFFAYSLLLAFLIIFLCLSKLSTLIPATISNDNGSGGMFIVARRNSRIGFPVRAVTGDQGSRNVSDVKFPSDYTELLMQVIGGRTQF